MELFYGGGLSSNNSLSDKQKLFCRKYLKLKFNATKAAISAGYAERSARQIAYRLLTKDDIQAELSRLVQKTLDKEEDAIEKWRKEVELLAFSDMRDYAQLEKDGVVKLKPTTEMGDEARAIQTLKMNEKGEMEYKMYDKKGSLDLLGKYYKLFKDKGDEEETVKTVKIIVLPDNGRNPTN